MTDSKQNTAAEEFFSLQFGGDSIRSRQEAPDSVQDQNPAVSMVYPLTDSRVYPLTDSSLDQDQQRNMPQQASAPCPHNPNHNPKPLP